MHTCEHTKEMVWERNHQNAWLWNIDVKMKHQVRVCIRASAYECMWMYVWVWSWHRTFDNETLHVSIELLIFKLPCNTFEIRQKFCSCVFVHTVVCNECMWPSQRDGWWVQARLNGSDKEWEYLMPLDIKSIACLKGDWSTTYWYLMWRHPLLDNSTVKVTSWWAFFACQVANDTSVLRMYVPLCCRNGIIHCTCGE